MKVGIGPVAYLRAKGSVIVLFTNRSADFVGARSGLRNRDQGVLSVRISYACNELASHSAFNLLGANLVHSMTILSIVGAI